MTHNATMAAALDGMQSVEPLLVLEANTCSHMMALLLLADLTADAAGPNPAHPDVEIQHPWQLFDYNSFHGGNLRCGYTGESIGAAIWLAGKVTPNKGTACVGEAKVLE